MHSFHYMYVTNFDDAVPGFTFVCKKTCFTLEAYAQVHALQLLCKGCIMMTAHLKKLARIMHLLANIFRIM